MMDLLKGILGGIKFVFSAIAIVGLIGVVIGMLIGMAVAL